MPKVSVIMPVFNTEKFLKQAIESILNQDFQDFEFIILDDFSTDKSFQICEEFAKKDKRIKLFQNQKNMWISFTRNKLISLTNTNFICTQDSDDISEKNRISKSFEFLEKNPEFAVCSSDLLIIDENSEEIWKRIYQKNIEKIILKKSPVANPASMFRKKIFFEVWWYDKELDYAEDYDLWLKIFAKWYKIFVFDEIFLKYRIRSNQTKKINLKETLKNTLKVQKKAIKQYKIKASFSDKIYHFLEKILLFLPQNFVLFLFKKLEYDKK